MIIAVATTNENKLREIGEILAQTNYKILALHDIIENPDDVVEDGQSFEENAEKKVAKLLSHPDRIYLGEDSGLEVDALGGAPGIYSARYAGPNATATDFCQKILRELDGESKRSAKFHSAIALKFPDGSITVVHGIVEGHVALEMRGENGFGYDPIFIPEGLDQTFGEMQKEEKHQLSHRYRALRQVIDIISAGTNN